MKKGKEKEKEKETKTNRNVRLVSSHSDNEHDDGPMLVCDNNGSAVSELYKNRLEAPFRYKPRPGETVIYEEVYIPDIDYN